MSPTLTNLLSGLIGSIIGGGSAIWAGRQAGRQQQRLQEEDRKHVAKGAMVAIKTELMMLQQSYLSDLASFLNATKEGKMLQTIYKVRQNYLTVYESNCTILGSLPEKEMMAIVRAYVEVKSLIDTHRANSDLYDLYLAAGENQVDRIDLAMRLNAYASVFRATFASAEKEVKNALHILDASRYLNPSA